MAQVTITLEDNEDGLVNQAVSYEGGYDVNSQAHQYSAIMIRMAADAVKQDQSDIVLPA